MHAVFTYFPYGLLVLAGSQPNLGCGHLETSMPECVVAGCFMEKNPFDGFHQQEIDHCRHGYKDKITERQRRKAQHVGEGTEGQIHSDSHYRNAR